MTQLGFKQRVIQSILGVPSSFISTWKKRYQAEGVDGLRLAYTGSSQGAQIHAKISAAQFGVVFRFAKRPSRLAIAGKRRKPLNPQQAMDQRIFK